MWSKQHRWLLNTNAVEELPRNNRIGVNVTGHAGLADDVALNR